MSWPTPLFAESGLTTAKRCGLPVPSCPIPGVNTAYVLTEEWQQLLTGPTTWTPLALNTAHPEYAGFVLVSETDPADVGGGHVRWKRTYAKKPASHDEWETFDYKFPAIIDIGNIGTSTRTSRNAQSEKVTSRLQHDYFLIGPSGADYTTPGAIPKNYATMYLAQGTLDSMTVGAIWAPAEYISNGEYTLTGVYYPKTTPTTSDYEKMVTDATTNEWSATVTTQEIQTDPGTNSAWVTLPGVGSATVYGGQIVAEDSRLTRWMGNIYLRTTRYVLAI